MDPNFQGCPGGVREPGETSPSMEARSGVDSSLSDALGDLDVLLAGILPSGPGAAPAEPWPTMREAHERLSPDVLGAACLDAAAAGQREVAAKHLEALAELAAEAEALRPSEAAVARRFEASGLFELGRIAEARAAVDTAMRLAEASGDEQAELAALLTAMRIVTLYGTPRETSALGESARRLARLLEDPAAREEADALAAHAWVMMGDVSRGLRLLDRTRQSAAEGGRTQVEKLAVCLSASAAIATSDWRAARDFALQLGTQPGPNLAQALPAILDAEACLTGILRSSERQHDLSLNEAVDLLNEAIDRARKTLECCRDMPALAARARRVLGCLLAERNDPGAVRMLDRALSEARGHAGPLELARSLLALATHGPRLDPQGTGQWREPARLFLEAEAVAAAAGAKPLCEQARRLLSAAGQAARGKPGSALLIRDERQELASLLEVGRAVSSILELDPLLERIMDEIISLLNADRGFVMLYDRPQPLLDQSSGEARSAERTLKVRVACNIDREKLASEEFRVSQGVVAEVERTREPLVIADAQGDPRFAGRTSILDLKLHSILCFPLKTSRTFLGVLWVDSRSDATLFQPRDLDLTLPFVAQAAVAIENAFAYEQIRELYEEALSITRAREKVIHHLSHELKTPLAVIQASLAIVGKRLESEPAVQRVLDRAHRNFHRLSEIQSAISEIYQSKGLKAPPEEEPKTLSVADLFDAVMAATRQDMAHRKLDVVVDCPSGLDVFAAPRPLKTALTSLLRNAVENTPDDGRIELSASGRGAVVLEVRDFGVGITPESRRHIFDGFYHTQETDNYSSRRPYDFDAGGKGLDLLRVRTYAERYGWELAFDSERCRYIPGDADSCPGSISACKHCNQRGDCLESGYTSFRISIPAGPANNEQQAGTTDGEA